METLIFRLINALSIYAEFDLEVSFSGALCFVLSMTDDFNFDVGSHRRNAVRLASDYGVVYARDTYRRMRERPAQTLTRTLLDCISEFRSDRLHSLSVHFSYCFNGDDINYCEEYEEPEWLEIEYTEEEEEDNFYRC